MPGLSSSCKQQRQYSAEGPLPTVQPRMQLVRVFEFKGFSVLCLRVFGVWLTSCSRCPVTRTEQQGPHAHGLQAGASLVSQAYYLVYLISQIVANGAEMP